MNDRPSTVQTSEIRRVLQWIWSSVYSAGWAPLLVFVFHVTISRGFGAYLALPLLDIPMHFLGGVAITYFIWRTLAQGESAGLLGHLTRLGRTIFCLASVCAAAVVWEFAEWTSDHAGLTQAQVGLGDTLLDMLLGIVGGAFYLFLHWMFASQSRAPFSTAGTGDE